MSVEVDIGVKNARFRQGLQETRNMAKQWSGDLKSMIVGAFSVGAIVAFAQRMREVQNQALRLGGSAESVQRISRVAKQADVDFEALAKTINKVTMEAGKAANGDKTAGNLFTKLNIDAAAFVRLNPEQKLMALAAAFEQSRSSGQATAAMLELLGLKGTQVIPLLARGPQALKKALAEVEVQTNSTVSTFAKLSKQIEKIEIFSSRMFDKAINSARTLTALLSWAVTDDYTIAAQADLESENMKRRKAGQPEIKGREATHWVAMREEKLRDDAIRETLNDEDKTDVPVTPANDFDPQSADEEKRKTLLDQIADQEAKNRADAKEGEARINELIEQRQELQQKANDDTVEGLEAKKKMLELDHEINAAQKAQQDKYDQAEKNEAKELEKQYLDKATPAQREKYLTQKQQRLLKEAKGEDDPVKALEKRTEAEAVQAQILEARKAKAKQGVSVSVDSLQRLGGGGGIGAVSDPLLRENQQQTALLRQLVHLQRGEVILGTPKDPL